MIVCYTAETLCACIYPECFNMTEKYMNEYVFDTILFNPFANNFIIQLFQSVTYNIWAVHELISNVCVYDLK